MPYKNIEDKKENRKQYYINNSEKEKEYTKQYYIDNKEKCDERDKQYYQNHKKEKGKYNREYKQNHPRDRSDYNRQWFKHKRKTDLKYNLNHRMRCSIYNAIRGNKAGKHWEILVGYSLNILIKHLEKTLPNNYTWQDYLKGRLQIDHITPVRIFNFTTPEHIDFRRCWDLSNLRLLPSKENNCKGGKLNKPFQPALKILILEEDFIRS